MKRKLTYRTLWTLLVGTLLMTSCIEDFVADIDEKDEQLLVVEGSIYSNSLCTFYLSSTQKVGGEYYWDDVGLGGEYGVSRLHAPRKNSFNVYKAEVSVKGSDGTSFPCENNPYHGGYVGVAYQVNVGTLKRGVKYWLQVKLDSLTYESEPQEPIFAVPIDSLSFAQEREDLEVDILVSTAPSETGEPQYTRWEYEEWWEIYTPWTAFMEYDPITDKIIGVTAMKHHGWANDSSKSYISATSEPFKDNRLQQYRLYSIGHTDNRLQTCYYTRVKEYAISKAEYEYENLRDRQSSDMGGIFTPQPSELPSNIHCLEEDRRAIGFVGVRGNVATCEMYIKKGQVKYYPSRTPYPISEEQVREKTWNDLYRAGYQVLTYETYPNGNAYVQWCPVWCIDCRNSFWKCSLEKPSFWRE